MGLRVVSDPESVVDNMEVGVLGGMALTLSILLFIFSKILSLEASFLDKPSIILAWPKINSLKGG